MLGLLSHTVYRATGVGYRATGVGYRATGVGSMPTGTGDAKNKCAKGILDLMGTY